jgi:hypothetical protein
LPETKIQTSEKREWWENSKVVGSADDSELDVKEYTVPSKDIRMDMHFSRVV